MPPKKGAKAIEEDFSDVPTLPELNSLIYTMILDFKNKDRKQEVYAKIKDTWKDKVKVITRDEIIDYGKKKLTIVEDEDVHDVNKVAKAASEKLYEQFVQARREKKERIDKLVEEAKATATEENPDPKPDINPNAIDCFFHLPDYPKTYEEAAALNSHQYALNAMIYIEERPVIIEKKVDPDLDEEGNPIEGTEQVIMEEEQVPEASRVPEEELKKQREVLECMKHALKDSAKDTAIRNFVVIKKEYNHKVPEPVSDGQEPPAEGVEKPVSIEIEVLRDLHKIAEDLIKYKDFKINSQLIKLKAAKPHLEVESRVEESQIKHDEVPGSQEMSKPPAEPSKDASKLDKSKAPDHSRIDASKVEEEPPKHSDETLPREWNDESYRKLVTELPEDKKSIAGLLAACVVNVCDELEKENKIIDQEHVEQNEDDEYKYIFDDVFDNVGSTEGFPQRNIMSASDSVFSKSAHKSMFSSAQRSRDGWNQDIVLDIQDLSACANDYVMANGDNISKFEKAVFEYLRTPGVDRCGMPSVPEKSQLRRDAEIPEIYPFSTIPVEELERAMMLSAIEDELNKDSSLNNFLFSSFDRSIEEKYTRSCLVQELSNSLLWEPDTVYKYFSRNDSLLLCIYQQLPVDKSYSKQWKASYKSMPDFGNWLEHFSKNTDSKIPLYDIDDNKVGHIREFTQNLTPTNGGLMRIKKHYIGQDELSQVLCFKDNIIFGIHAKVAETDLSDDFWIQYDLNSRLDFRRIQNIDRYITELPDENLDQIAQNESHEAPPADDPEAEKARKEQLAAAKAQREEERQNALHQEYSAYRLQGAVATLAFQNGHLVGMLPNGYIMQSKSHVQKELIVNPDQEFPEDLEESRVITSKSVIRYLANGKIEILYANGNFSEYDPQTDLWTVTNNNGKRRCKRQSNGDTYDIDPIPAAIETCAETSAQVLFKEDNVISILYPNGTRYTIHHEGTKIITNADESEIVFEKIGYSLVKVLSGSMLDEHEVSYIEEENDAEVEFNDSLTTSRQFLKDRIKDGQVMQTYLHDRTVIQSFIEVNEFGKPRDLQEIEDHEEINEGTHPEGDDEQAEQEFSDHQAIHLIFKQDMSVTKVSQDNEICFISGPTRLDLNKNGQLLKLGRDVDYLYQLFNSHSNDRKGGIFTCSLDHSNITTHDKDRNYFAVNSKGTFEKVLAPEISEVDQVNDLQDHDEMNEIHDIEGDHVAIQSQGSKENAVPKVDLSKSKIKQEDQTEVCNQLPVPPRIFCIKNDGSGSEFFTKERMQEETGRFSSDVMIIKSTEILGQNPVLMHSYFKPLKTNEEVDEEFSVVSKLQATAIEDCRTVDDIAIPKNVEEYPQVFRELVDKPRSKIYLYKNYMQHKDFDYFKKKAYQDDLQRYKKWKEDSDAAIRKKFGLFEPTEELKDRAIDKRIMEKIYRERQTTRQDLDAKSIKDRRILAITEKVRKVASKEDSPIKVDDKKEAQDKSDIVEDDARYFKQDTEKHVSQEIAPPGPDPMMDFTGEQPKKKMTQIIREEIAELKSEPFFVSNYFKTQEGLEFVKLNPPKPPNDEVLMRMSQRMSRSIGNGTEGGAYSSQGAENDHDHDQVEHLSAAGSQNKDIEDNNPIVALEPEDDENRDQMRMSGMKHSMGRSQMEGTLEEPSYIPSMYLQEKDYLKRRDEEHLLKAEEYHVSKTKEFNVYGKLRPLKIKVKSIAKSNAKPEMNERFITTESITDKRIKISSMANRAYLNAPSVNQVRKQGQHQMIMQAITKKQTFNELISQANAMVTSVLNDPLKRSVNILPSQANFGSLREGGKYELTIACKNEDMIPQRINIRPAKDKRIRIQQESTTLNSEDKGGPIAPGVSKVIRVTINCNLPGESVISDSFEIMTKTDIYKIPITATILDPEKFDEINAETMKIHNMTAMRSTVREVPSRQKKKVKDILTEYERNPWIETTNTESKLPQLPNIKNRAFEPDSQRELDDVIAGNSSKAPSRRDSNASRLSKRSKASRMSNRG